MRKNKLYLVEYTELKIVEVMTAIFMVVVLIITSLGVAFLL